MRFIMRWVVVLVLLLPMPLKAEPELNPAEALVQLFLAPFYQKEHVLLVLAPDGNNADFKAQMQVLDGAADALIRQHVRVFTGFATDVLREGNLPIPNVQAALFYHVYGVKKQEFALVLLDKSGPVRIFSFNPMSADDILLQLRVADGAVEE